MMSVANDLVTMMQYGFVHRALLAGTLIAASCSALGVFLVLRRFSLIGDGLAHVSFATVALALALHGEPLMVSLPLVALASLGVLAISERARGHADAAIGLVSAFGLATGVMIASVSGGFNVDLFSYLFGSILTITASEVYLTVAVALAVLGVIALLYHDLFAVTFDPEHARASGINVRRTNMLLVVLTSIVIVLGIKIVGTMLVSSLIIVPALTALEWGKSFRTCVVTASIVAVVSVVVGIVGACLANLPAGASIVYVNFGVYVVTLVVKRGKR